MSKKRFEDGSKYIVCLTCDGEGTIVHSDCSVWTHEDREADPEGFEKMMNGGYDITCPDCNGHRVMTPEQIEDRELRREELDNLRRGY